MAFAKNYYEETRIGCKRILSSKRSKQKGGESPLSCQFLMSNPPVTSSMASVLKEHKMCSYHDMLILSEYENGKLEGRKKPSDFLEHLIKVPSLLLLLLFFITNFNIGLSGNLQTQK